MVAAELGVSALEGRVSGSLGLLDTVCREKKLVSTFGLILVGCPSPPISSDLNQVVMLGRSYPLR